jgi:hypothetical protein
MPTFDDVGRPRRAERAGTGRNDHGLSDNITLGARYERQSVLPTVPAHRALEADHRERDNNIVLWSSAYYPVIGTGGALSRIGNFRTAERRVSDKER